MYVERKREREKELTRKSTKQKNSEKYQRDGK